MRVNFIIIFVLIVIINCSKSSIKTDINQNAVYYKSVFDKYQSENWVVRYQAIVELSNYIKTPFYDEIEILLLKATYDNHPKIKILSLELLSHLPSGRIINRIIDMASETKDDNVKLYALMTLSEYKSMVTYPIFVSGLESQDWLIRDVSMKGLLLINDYEDNNKIIPYILKGLNDPSDIVVITTLENLNIKDDKIYREIITIFNKVYKNNIKNSLLLACLHAIRGYRLDDDTRKKVINLLTDLNKDIRLLSLRILKDEKLDLKIH